jgi:hypothetical protein
MLLPQSHKALVQAGEKRYCHAYEKISLKYLNFHPRPKGRGFYFFVFYIINNK